MWSPHTAASLTDQSSLQSFLGGQTLVWGNVGLGSREFRALGFRVWKLGFRVWGLGFGGRSSLLD